MRSIKLLLFACVLAVSVSAQSEQIVPLVELKVGGVIGGVQNGKWIKNVRKVAQTVKAGASYRVIGFSSAASKEATGTKPETGAPCEDFEHIELNTKPDSGVALGASADWNPLPRVPVAIAATDANYKRIVGSVLQSKGIARAIVQIKQAFRVDLDGDGTDEVVLAATYFKSGRVSPKAAVGDYSFVLLRKIVDGKVQNIVIEGEFIKKAVEFGAVSEYMISSIADLNGDGKMEIVVHSFYYEGNYSSVYEINGAKASAVLGTGCGV